MVKPKTSLKSVKEDLRYLRLLSRDFPTISRVTREIINLEAILHLPKSTEHFLADLHGENEAFQHLGSVATNNGYSDWATTAIPADVKTMWYRFSRRGDDFCIECSSDGIEFSQMRICHMYAAADEISFGIYACSPEESSFTAVFTDMKITECAWKAHDGQQPDEN